MRLNCNQQNIYHHDDDADHLIGCVTYNQLYDDGDDCTHGVCHCHHCMVAYDWNLVFDHFVLSFQKPALLILFQKPAW